MSNVIIQQCLNQLATLRKVSGSARESLVREAFKDLLKGWARSHVLVFIPEFEITTPAKDRRYVDGALLYSLRVPFGYWEAKDEKDDRSALEWILDQYKEKKPNDPTTREKINTYRFADYKEKVIDLLMRVTTVSVGTMEVVGEMRMKYTKN